MRQIRGELGPDLLADLDARLDAVDAELAAAARRPPPARRPVHTVYVPADRFDAGTPSRWGARARDLLDRHAPDAAAVAAATGLDAAAVADALPRVRAKLADEPVEDLRVDFEDGFGSRPDAEEDAAAVAAGRGIAALAGTPGAPFALGIRVKSMEAGDRRRAVRTLDLVLAGMRQAGGGPALRVTLPKVSAVAQVEAAVAVADAAERAYRLPGGALVLELQVEMPRAVLDADGTATVARLVRAAGDRCGGLHYGTYDYSAACGVAAGHQSLAHPVADHAKAVMLLAAVDAGVPAVDGSTNVLPTGDGDAVRAAWRLHAGLVTRALERAYYQGWDLDAGHLPTRYLATYAFFRAALPAAAARLRAYLDRSHSGVLDEPATARALSAAVLRGLDCRALDGDEVRAATGLDLAGLRALARRQPGGPVAGG